MTEKKTGLSGTYGRTGKTKHWTVGLTVPLQAVGTLFKRIFRRR